MPLCQNDEGGFMWGNLRRRWTDRFMCWYDLHATKKKKNQEEKNKKKTTTTGARKKKYPSTCWCTACHDHSDYCHLLGCLCKDLFLSRNYIMNSSTMADCVFVLETDNSLDITSILNTAPWLMYCNSISIQWYRYCISLLIECMCHLHII